MRFADIPAGGTFRMIDLHSDAAHALGSSTTDYKLGSLHYLSKLRAKGLMENLLGSRS